MDSYYQTQLEAIKQRRRERHQKSDTANGPVPRNRGSHAGRREQGEGMGTAYPSRTFSPICDEEHLARYKNVYTKKSPFRTQTFQEYLLNPEPDVPDETVYSLTNKDNHGAFGAGASSSTFREFQFGVNDNDTVDMTSHGHSTWECGEPGLFGPTQSVIESMKQGDWFLKWSSRKTSVFKRFVRLNAKATGLQWARSPDSFLNSSIEFSAVIKLEPLLINRDASKEEASVVYVMRLWTRNYDLQIGTELREKFNLWYEAIQQLVDRCNFGRSNLVSSAHTTQPNIPSRTQEDETDASNQATYFSSTNLPQCSDPSE